MPFAATLMDLEMTILHEVSQIEKEILYHLNAEYKRMIQMNLFTKQKQAHRHQKQTYDYQRGKVGEAG